MYITLITRFSDELLDRTISVWQPRCPNRKLTREDAHEIIVNMTGFFRLLLDSHQHSEAVDFSRGVSIDAGLKPKLDSD